MKLKKLTALAMTTAMCAATVFGCGGSEGKDGETTTVAGSGSGSSSTEETKKDVALKVWCPQEDQNAGWITKVCDDFKKAHPNWNITFTVETCSEADAAKNMSTDPTTGADVYMFASDQLTTLLNADAIAKLGGEAANYVKETNSQTVVASVSVGQDVYALPFTGNTWFMYYDKSVFSDDDIKSLDKMLEKGKVAFPITNGWYFASFYAAGGGVFCGPNGDDEKAGVVLGDKATDVTKYLVDLAANPNFIKDDQGSGINGLKDKSVNAIFSGTWDYQNVKDILGDNIGVAQLPTININGTAGTLKSFAGSKAVAVNPNTKDMEVSVAFAKYLASEEAQKSHYEMRNIVPCNTVLLQSEAVKNDAVAQAQDNTIVNTSIPQPSNVTFSSNYWDNAGSFANDILDGKVTKDNAAEKTVAFEKAINGNK